MIDYSLVLIEKYPRTSWKMENSFNYETLEWYEKNIPKPTQQEMEYYWENVIVDKLKIQAIYKQRVFEYPSIGDQLDALFHAGVFPPEMAAQIQAVKDKYPKPE